MTNMDDTFRLTVLYASQTGTAQDYAERLWQDAKRRQIPVLLQSLQDYQVINLINERVVVFVCSTTGQGDEPDNMKSFWKFLLRRDLPLDSLENLQFAVLGLGDSSYEKFNFVAKKLYRRLIQLSAKNFMELGLADDQHDFGPDTVADPWIAQFWEEIIKMSPVPVQEPMSGLLPSRYKIIFSDNLQEIIENGVSERSSLNYSKHNPFFAKILENVRLTPPEHFQDTRLIRLDIKYSNFRYSPGDVVCVQPSNLLETVEEFMKICDNIDFHAKFFLKSNDNSFCIPPNFILPQPTSFYHCLQTYFDIQSTPRRSFFKNLSYFAVDEREKEKLDELSACENLQDLYSYCNRPRRTVVEVLLDFSDTAKRVPLEYWFDLLTPIRPRSFSIASSPSVHKGEIHILLAVVRFKTLFAKLRLGLCSNWLARLNFGDPIPVWVQSGTFKFPTNSNAPYLMVGPGTGVAPFRSLIHDRIYSNCKLVNILFFGCRNEKSDFYFVDEWSDLQDKNNNLLQLFVAFSRDQEKKIYVQDKIQENYDFISDLIFNKNVFIFVAGNAKQMPKDVISALKSCVRKTSSLNENQIELLFKKLEKENKIQMETWS